MIDHYGMMGLEGYNHLKGTKFEFDGVEKFQTRSYEVGSYKIFFKAHMDQSPPTTFCTLVDLGDRSCKELDLGFPIATQINENGEFEFIKSNFEESDEYDSEDEYFRKIGLPDWPTERVLNDNEVQASEFQDHKIRQYLGMVYCGDNKYATNRQLNDLNIVKVAVMSVPYPESMCKFFYITFQDVNGRNGARFERKAIVRRFINNSTGYLTLTGRFLSAEEASRKKPSPKLSIRARSWLKVAESDGFDIEDDSICHRTIRMSSYSNPEWFKDDSKVILYAKAGLHRYNILKGTRLELSAVMKFNKTMNCVSSYYITLVARDLDAAAGSKEETFQVRVDEQSFGKLDMTVSVARRKDEIGTTENKIPFTPHFHCDGVPDGFYKGELPKWPSNNALKNRKRFYVVNDSEIQDNDWIRLYLELAVCVDSNGRATKADLAKLQITKVAIETIEEVDPPSERLKAKSANFYITYKGWFNRQIEEGGEMERKAIIRRVLNEEIGYFTLLGRVSIGEKALATTTKQSSKKRPRS
ncbi:unnamed protein product [Microthlaspi erraticum]|uniref:Uncharacterized protein n=1 Tax=Microthlaspi erraticum TaxID=1685480 RepID=A0A6D2IHT5_9BRAS|nr:unnamed protein product [Microthlaspi erraticum]